MPNKHKADTSIAEDVFYAVIVGYGLEKYFILLLCSFNYPFSVIQYLQPFNISPLVILQAKGWENGNVRKDKSCSGNADNLLCDLGGLFLLPWLGSWLLYSYKSKQSQSG